MKRYLVFAYYEYYPNGGWNDYVDSLDTIEEAKTKSIELKETYETVEIIDKETGDKLQ